LPGLRSENELGDHAELTKLVVVPVLLLFFAQLAGVFVVSTLLALVAALPLVALTIGILAMSARLGSAGFWAVAISPPTVPAGTARLRLAFTAAHEEADVDRLLDALAEEDVPRRASAM